jgi:transposase
MGDRLVSTLDHKLKPEPAVQRLEVITGTGRRRRISNDDKARIVEETLAEGAVVSAVARRHGLTPQQVFTWRRQAQRAAAEISDQEVAQFVPAIVEAPAELPRQRRTPSGLRRHDGFGDIEVEIGGMTVRVGRGADAKMVMAVLRALKAGA